MTHRLVAVDLPAGPEFVTALVAAWEAGDAVLPLDARLPAPARRRVLTAMAPSVVLDRTGEHHLSDGRPVEAGDALVVATSGTTGESKGVVLTHDAVAASARATSARLGMAATDHWLACLPLAHVGGLSVVTRSLVTGTALTVLAGFDVEAVHAAADRGATSVSLVPTALARIDATRFRRIVLGGSTPPASLPPHVVVTYGMTETGSGVVYDGVPLDGVDVRIDGHGEIHVRGPMLLRAYRDQTSPLVSGWLPTGDGGRWLDDGRLHVDGRRADLIITGGENVWPEPVEAVLRTHRSVADVVVRGRPDDEWGQVVVATIVPVDTDRPTLDELRSWVKATLPAHHAPRVVEFATSVERTTSGKLRH